MVLRFDEKTFEILLLPSGEVITVNRRNLNKLISTKFITYKRFVDIDGDMKDVHGYISKDEYKYKIFYIDEI